MQGPADSVLPPSLDFRIHAASIPIAMARTGCQGSRVEVNADRGQAQNKANGLGIGLPSSNSSRS
jgi:hypothetical protein